MSEPRYELIPMTPDESRVRIDAAYAAGVLDEDEIGLLYSAGYSDVNYSGKAVQLTEEDVARAMRLLVRVGVLRKVKG